MRKNCSNCLPNRYCKDTCRWRCVCGHVSLSNNGMRQHLRIKNLESQNIVPLLPPSSPVFTTLPNHITFGTSATDATETHEYENNGSEIDSPVTEPILLNVESTLRQPTSIEMTASVTESNVNSNEVSVQSVCVPEASKREREPIPNTQIPTYLVI